MKKLSDAEFEIMKILWNSKDKLTSNQILDALQGYRDWKLASLMTVLSRMAEKEFVYCDRSTRTNYYTPLISQKDYNLTESKNFLQKLYDSSIKNMIATLYDNKEMKDSDITELRKFLDDLEGKQ